VLLFESAHHRFGVQLGCALNPERALLALNARNQHDRARFVEDLQESVREMDEMEALRIEEELGKQVRNADLAVAPAYPPLPPNRFSGDSGLQVDLEQLGAEHSAI